MTRLHFDEPPRAVPTAASNDTQLALKLENANVPHHVSTRSPAQHLGDAQMLRKTIKPQIRRRLNAGYVYHMVNLLQYIV